MSKGGLFSTSTQHVERRKPQLLSMPTLRPSTSAPALPSLPPHEVIYSRKWTTEHKRYFHERGERRWLTQQSKHRFIDFSNCERAELQRYYNSLAEGRSRVKLVKLEDFMISLGLASTRREVKRIVESVQEEVSDEIDFEEFLTIVKKRADKEVVPLFLAMMEGKLGDHNLDFQTVISLYRRHLILDAIGVGSSVPEQQSKGKKLLHNFSELQKRRWEDAEEKSLRVWKFDAVGRVPLGSLADTWQYAQRDLSLVSSRPQSADGTSKRMEKPKSPREVINDVLKDSQKGKKRAYGHARGTIMVGETDDPLKY